MNSDRRAEKTEFLRIRLHRTLWCKPMEKWKLEPAHDHGLKPAQRWQSLHRESGLLESAAHMVWGLGVRFYLQCWHRLAIRGREHLPIKPPFVLTANHS